MSPPPPPHPKSDPVVHFKALESNLIVGTKKIKPDAHTRARIQRNGERSIKVTVDLCIAKSGVVTSAHIVRSSNYPDYDDKIVREVQKWRFRPISIAGEFSPACTNIPFAYVQS